jgi:hypothetical protein
MSTRAKNSSQLPSPYVETTLDVLNGILAELSSEARRDALAGFLQPFAPRDQERVASFWWGAASAARVRLDRDRRSRQQPPASSRVDRNGKS